MIEDAEIAVAFGVDEADVTDAMREAVDRALDWVETETDRHFREPQEFVEEFMGGVETIWLDETPIINESGEGLTAEEWDSGLESWEDTDDVADTEYDVREPRKPYMRTRLVHNTRWPAPGCGKYSRTENIRITWSAGYEVGELPGDIEALVLVKAKSDFGADGTVAEGLKKEMVDGYSYERFGTEEGRVTGLTDEHQSTLDRWTHKAFA